MKTVIYALINDKAYSWHLTLDVRADMAYWFGEHPNSLKIWVLEPAVSFGQALTLTAKLNEMQESTKHAKGCSPDLLLKTIHQQAERLDIPLARRAGSHQGLLLECDSLQWEGYRQTAEGSVTVRQGELDGLVSILRGRSLLVEETNQLMEHHALQEAMKDPLLYMQMGYLRGKLQLSQGISLHYKRTFPSLNHKPVYECRRCGADAKHMVMTDCLFCGTSCPYCEQCLTMGRSRFCSILISAPANHNMDQETGSKEEEEHDFQRYLEPWGLSNVQAEASYLALTFLKGNEWKAGAESKYHNKPQQFLIWAVTGAGKTEMIFPMIQYMLSRGKCVVIATPRRDVVLELRPRLEKAFAPLPVVTLYGGSEQRWDTGTLTIATTHQLLRFERAFDLVIIDEIDAFPYHNSPMLEYAARKVCTIGGVTLLLSATPPRQLQRAAERGILPHVKVAARYHRHPLPVPVLLPTPSLSQQQKRAAIPRSLHDKLSISLNRGAQIFIFVPKIQLIEPFVQLLRRIFSGIVIQGTSSKDELRAQKVIDFRNKNIRMLVTTTILERGVTIAKSDVYIMDADAQLFDSASLVQMAGRAGRSADDPAGLVFFAAKERTREQVEAVRQIKAMNALARKKGYLHSKGEQSP
jgi:competence protein ComFA